MEIAHRNVRNEMRQKLKELEVARAKVLVAKDGAAVSWSLKRRGRSALRVTRFLPEVAPWQSPSPSQD